MSGHLFLGVDGGQSSTTALIGDERGRVAGAGRSGACNHVGAAEGRTKFVHAIRGCLAAACQQAALDAASVRFRAACLGFSGGPADKEAILREILQTDRMTVTSDALIALSGALEGRPGIVAIAGTGSIAFGRNAAGDAARAGGWGYVFGDEGGAFDIARRALRAALRFEEGWGPETALRTAFLNAADARDANDLLHRFYTAEFPRPAIAALAKLVDRTAESGDPAAQAILRYAAARLAEFTSGVRGKLFPGEVALVAPLGGVFRSRIVLSEFSAIVERDGNRIQSPAYGPAAGALLEAYRLAAIAAAPLPVLSNLPEEKI